MLVNVDKINGRFFGNTDKGERKDITFQEYRDFILKETGHEGPIRFELETGEVRKTDDPKYTVNIDGKEYLVQTLDMLHKHDLMKIGFYAHGFSVDGEETLIMLEDDKQFEAIKLLKVISDEMVAGGTEEEVLENLDEEQREVLAGDLSQVDEWTLEDIDTEIH